MDRLREQQRFKELSEVPARLYAVGDLHGCADDLKALIEFLTSQEKLTKKDIVVFIGDYIDRGPASKSVIEELLKFQSAFPDSIFLKGNHEDMLLAFLGFDGRDGSAYLMNGGDAFLESYGIKPEDILSDESQKESLTEAHTFEQKKLSIDPKKALTKLPQEHVNFFRQLTSYVIGPSHIFAHAGVNPLRDLKHQLPGDLYWIRDEFIENIHYFGKPVVFGHTPYEDVMFHLPYKIGIDTGLVYGNKLSCIELTEGKILQFAKGSAKCKVKGFPK